jgi:bifunctional non-homologous end joining protein LigD
MTGPTDGTSPRRRTVDVDVGGRRLRLSNLDKVLWPEAGFTKGRMIDYYARVAPVLVPHLAGRGCPLARFPDGVEAYGWFQTQCRGRPEWMRAAPLGGITGEVQHYCVVEDLASLVWVANNGAIELHPLLSLADRPDRATAAVFDLDPGPPAGLVECCWAALRVREVLAGLDLQSFPKASGALGLHVFVPLDGSQTFAHTKAFARAVATGLARTWPDRIVAHQARADRAGRVLVDWLQNDANRSTVAPYSLRAMTWPTVSMPLRWEEVEHTAEDGRWDTLVYDPDQAVERIEAVGDLFAPVLELEQELPQGV